MYPSIVQYFSDAFTVPSRVNVSVRGASRVSPDSKAPKSYAFPEKGGSTPHLHPYQYMESWLAI
jgi:hypothetical protein